MPRPIKQSRELAAIAAKVLDVQTSISKPPKKPSAPKKPTPAARAAAIRAEEERALIRQTMSILGSRKSAAKTRAVRKNAQLAGRPLGSKDKKPRKPRTPKATP